MMKLMIRPMGQEGEPNYWKRKAVEVLAQKFVALVRSPRHRGRHGDGESGDRQPDHRWKRNPPILRVVLKEAG